MKTAPSGASPTRHTTRTGILTAVVIIGVVWIAAGLTGRSDAPESPIVSSTAPHSAMPNLIEQPTAFVENQGQWDVSARYVARARGVTAYLHADAVTLQLERRKTENGTKRLPTRMIFEEASETVTLEGERAFPGSHSFFQGDDRSKWRSDVPGYSSVIYKNLYEGVDLRVRETSGSIEYDVLLAEGADLNQVVIRWEGILGLEVEADGSLTIETKLGPITQRPPETWVVLPDDERQPVECRFRKIDEHRYGFDAPERDEGMALVIDPMLEWSTYVGGSGTDAINSVVLDASRNIIVCGITTTPDLDTTPGVVQENHAGNYDWFVSCLGPNGEQHLWTTYLGGALDDIACDMGIDDAGRLIVAGVTASSDFPTTPGAYDETFDGGHDGAVACFTDDGTVLAYSTLLGGVGEDRVSRLVADASGEVTVVGLTWASEFPTTVGAYDTSFNGLSDAFVTRLNATGTDLVFSTFLGGEFVDGVSMGQVSPLDVPYYQSLAIDGSGMITTGGMTMSPDFPTTVGAHDQSSNGGWDGYVARLSADGSSLVYGTYLGSTSGECVNEIVVDDLGQATVSGYTYSENFPTTPGAFDETFNSVTVPNNWNDAFVGRLDDMGALLYSTFVGGAYWDGLGSLVLESSGELVCAGFTNSPDFPTRGTWGDDAYIFDDTLNGMQDAVLVYLSLDGNGADDLLYSTFCGGPTIDWSSKVVPDPGGELEGVILVGACGPGFPVTPGAYDTDHGNPDPPDYDGFVCRFFDRTVGVDEPVAGDAPSIALGPVFPNPTDGALSYSVDLLEASAVQVHVFDVRGRRVQTLIDRELSAGTHNLSMELNGSGEALPGGVYYLRLDAEGMQTSRQFILAR